MDCLEKAQIKKGPGELVAVVLCALSDVGDEAVLGLEWVVLLINPSVAPVQPRNPWLRPEAEHRHMELSCPMGCFD